MRKEKDELCNGSDYSLLRVHEKYCLIQTRRVFKQCQKHIKENMDSFWYFSKQQLSAFGKYYVRELYVHSNIPTLEL